MVRAARKLSHSEDVAVAVAMNQLDAVESAVEEQEKIAKTNATLELRLHDVLDAVEALAHVDAFGVQEVPGRTSGAGDEEGGMSGIPASRAASTISWNAASRPMRRRARLAKSSESPPGISSAPSH